MSQMIEDKIANAIKQNNGHEQNVFRTIPASGIDINPNAKYVEMTLTSSTVETYNYYESSSKVILYNTITITYTDATKDVLSSVEWS